MKISIRNLLSLVCTFVLLGMQVLPAYTWADNVTTGTASTLSTGMIGKVTYLLGQADVTKADGSVLPLAVQMGIPDGSSIHVKERGLVRLLMVDGGIEKLGSNTVFTFDKYTYDPNDAQATEIRKTLLNGEVTSTTGQGGKDAKEHYRLNSPLAAIAVLGTEYTVKVSNGETWVTVHSGEISIAKLGGSCQRSGLGACAGGERLSEGQRGLAMVVRASEPKPILMPATAIPVSEKKPETAPVPVKEEPAKSEQAAAASDKPADSGTSAKAESDAEPQKNTEAAAPSAQANQQTSTVATNLAAASPATIAEKTSSEVSPTPVTEKPPIAKQADERNALETMFPALTAKAASTVESASASAVSASTASVVASGNPVAGVTPTAERVQLPSVTQESVAAVLTTSKVNSTQQQEATVSTTTKVKQTLVQASSNSVAIEKKPVITSKAVSPTVESVPEKSKVVTASAAVVAPAVAEPVLEKPKVTTASAAVVAPAVAEPIPEQPKVTTVVESVPEKPKVVTATVTTTPIVEPVPEKPKVVTVTATVVAPAVAEPVLEKPKVATATAAVVTPVVAEPVLEKPKVTTATAAVMAPAVTEPVPEKPKVVTTTVTTTPTVGSVPEKPKVTTVTAAVVAPAVVAPVPEKPKIAATVAVTVTPPAVIAPVPEQPKTVSVVPTPTLVPETVKAVAATTPTPVTTVKTTSVVTPTLDKPTVAAVVPLSPVLTTPKTVTALVVTTPVVQAKPAVMLESAVPTVNWGKYDPAASVDGKTSFSEQVGSSYTQLIQSANVSPSTLGLQQNPSVSLPEPDQHDVGVSLNSAVAPVNNADAGKTTSLSNSAGTLSENGAVSQTPLPVPLNATVGVSGNNTADTLTPPIGAPLSADGILDRTSASPLTPLTLTSPSASP